MGTMKKRKKKARPQKTTLKRAQRLLKARHWLSGSTQTGKQLVHAYAKKFRTGLLCAIVDLRLLDVTITAEYEKAVKHSMIDLAEQKRKKKKEQINAHLDGVKQDEHFAYIVGYTTPGGSPYGLTWTVSLMMRKERYTVIKRANHAMNTMILAWSGKYSSKNT